MFKKFIRIFINIVLIIAIISNGINIIKQFVTLEEAKNRNVDLAEALINLKKNNINLVRKIEDATDSAFWAQQSRVILGMGTDNDYWIDCQSEEDVNLYPKAKTQKKEANLLKWIKLFTN
jgi:hypothetical protein